MSPAHTKSEAYRTAGYSPFIPRLIYGKPRAKVVGLNAPLASCPAESSSQKFLPRLIEPQPRSTVSSEQCRLGRSGSPDTKKVTSWVTTTTSTTLFLPPAMPSPRVVTASLGSADVFRPALPPQETSERGGSPLPADPLTEESNPAFVATLPKAYVSLPLRQAGKKSSNFVWRGLYNLRKDPLSVVVRRK